MIPTKSYRIWFSQRNGSTLLCKGLEHTEIAGIPGEYLNPSSQGSLCHKYGVKTYDELKQAIWDLGTTSNDVFGIKHSLHSTYSAHVFGEIRSLRGLAPATDPIREDSLDDLFPNCKHIFLTRRNKVRQAVSWWKAINDNVWHLDKHDAQEIAPDFYTHHYDFAALEHLFKEAALRECAMQEYFSKHDIDPMTLVYEDLVNDFAGTIRKVLDFLELEYDGPIVVRMHYTKTSNEHSEKWVQRFRKDLQQKMPDQIW